MDVLVLIDKLDDLVHNAKPVPLTDQVRVDKEEIYDILDQMRATIPEEIKQARWIVKERQEMLAEAKREAGRTGRGPGARRAGGGPARSRMLGASWKLGRGDCRPKRSGLPHLKSGAEAGPEPDARGELEARPW